MSIKSDFNAEEWSQVTEAPALAALHVMVAERGGAIRESISLGKAYAEARRRDGGELLGEVVASPPQLDPTSFGGPDQLREQVPQRLREAIEIVERKTTPEDAAAYREFVMGLAETVARAHKEGGVLGIGGKEISASEQAALDELATTLGSGAR